MQRRATSQDISWFLDIRRHNQFDLNPPYQRKSVWNSKDQRYFLDTIFRGYPCPAIFLHKTVNDSQQTIYAVVDGKQRLQTLFGFADDQIAIDPQFGDERFNGKLFSQLQQSERELFWNYVIPVEFLVFDANGTQEVNLAFDRLNRNMRKLEPQELRHARWDGWFITLVETECEDPIWRTLGVVTNARSKRMKDAQFISELVLLLIEGRQTGFDQQTLDNAYSKYDDPADPAFSVNEDELKDKLVESKRYLVEMQEHNGCIKKHASTVSMFYTLWAAVTLHRDRLGDPKESADVFTTFCGIVSAFEDSTEKPTLLSGTDQAKYKCASEYLEGTKASTDLAPRTKRLEAFLKFVDEECER